MYYIVPYYIIGSVLFQHLDGYIWVITIQRICYIVEVPFLKETLSLLQSLGSRSENWLRPQNWAKDFDFLSQPLPWPF